MGKKGDLSQRARVLAKEERKEILLSFQETELHRYLKELFKEMEPDYLVEITHGPDELGKDLVIVKRDKMTTDVIGVVVKCGDLKAKTLGGVDDVIQEVNAVFPVKGSRRLQEIQSQISQAFNHAAEIKTNIKALPVNKVFVVLAGSISKQARRRLEGEMKGPVEVFDLDWLIEGFTAYYPELFFEGRVTDFLQTRLQELETKNWLIKAGKNLSECFVDPVVESYQVSSTGDPGAIFPLPKKKVPFSRLASLITARRKILLIGEPGTGKSAALAKLAIDLLRQSYNLATKAGEEKRRISAPVLVTARAILDSDTPDHLLSGYFKDEDTSERFDVTVLLVDGLDEVESVRRSEVIDRCSSFSEHFGSSLLVSSRRIDIVRTPPPGFEKYEILPFEINQALRLFEKVLTDNQKLTTLREGLEKIRYQIPIIPLSLMLLIELVEAQREVPASVTELYDRFLDFAPWTRRQEEGHRRALRLLGEEAISC